MNKKYLLLSLFIAVSLLIFNTNKVTSNIASPPPGATGDPQAANTCARIGCHVTTPVQTPAGSDFTFNIGTGSPTTPITNSFEYVPGTIYNLALIINAAGTRYGFELSTGDASQNQAGSFTVSDAVHTATSAAFNRSYMGHKDASAFKNWVFKWTAPSAGTGPVTMNLIYNRANGDGTPLDDQIFKEVFTIQEQTTGITDIAEKISSLNIFPNPISNEFSISFDLKETNTVSMRLNSLDGKLCKELLNEKLNDGRVNQSFDINALPSGIYLLKLNVGEASVTKKIFKQ
ncbi:MAG: choice-of-anchor V domain-containing protein [Bacteroidota bacterium]